MIPKRFIALVNLTRPFTLLAPLLGSVFMMYGSGGERILQEWHTVIFVAVTIVLLTAGSNILNQIADASQDRVTKKRRPIPSGKIKREEALVIALALYAFALFRSATVNASFSLILFLIAVVTMTYSLPPRIKKRKKLNVLWVGLARGFLGPLAAWSVFADPLDPTALRFCIVCFIYVMGSVPLKDIGDVEFEKRVITLGRERERPRMHITIMVYMVGLIVASIIAEEYLWLPLGIPGIIVLFTLGFDRVMMVREHHLSWYLSYITFTLLMIVFGAVNAP